MRLPNEQFVTRIAGVYVVARQYVGIGTLNVSTPRGELKAGSGDFIVTFGDGDTCLMTERHFNDISEPEEDKEDPSAKAEVLNTQTGEIEVKETPKPTSASETGFTESTASMDLEDRMKGDGGASAATTTSKPAVPLEAGSATVETAGQVAPILSPSVSSTQSPQVIVPQPQTSSFELLKARADRGDKLTSEEELRLLDGK